MAAVVAGAVAPVGGGAGVNVLLVCPEPDPPVAPGAPELNILISSSQRLPPRLVDFMGS